MKHQRRPQACLSGVLARSYATRVVSCRGGSNRLWRGNWLYSSPGPWHPPLALIIYKLLLNQGAPGPAYEEKLHLYVLHIWLQQTRHTKLKFLKLFAWLFDINNLISYEFWRHTSQESWLIITLEDLDINLIKVFFLGFVCRPLSINLVPCVSCRVQLVKFT